MSSLGMEKIPPAAITEAEAAVNEVITGLSELRAMSIRQRALVMIARNRSSKFYAHDRELAMRLQPSFFLKLPWYQQECLLRALVLSPA